jgi:hypothetical protein
MSDKRTEGTAELSNSLEAVVNLLYLIRIDRHDPDRVLQWVDMAEGQSKRMESTLQCERPPLPTRSVKNQIEN